jgi:hypothetical protein
MSHQVGQMTLNAMSSCVPERFRATRQDGGLGSRCSSIAAWWHGPARGRPPRPHRHLQPHPNPRRSAQSSSVRWRAWRWRACQGDKRP